MVCSQAFILLHVLILTDILIFILTVSKIIGVLPKFLKSWNEKGKKVRIMISATKNSASRRRYAQPRTSQ